ncbi:MAG TPA: hypothetical protein V6C81_21525 [Planktothrix sp.]|jgi:hypothetical protein
MNLLGQIGLTCILVALFCVRICRDRKARGYANVLKAIQAERTNRTYAATRDLAFRIGAGELQLACAANAITLMKRVVEGCWVGTYEHVMAIVRLDQAEQILDQAMSRSLNVANADRLISRHYASIYEEYQRDPQSILRAGHHLPDRIEEILQTVCSNANAAAARVKAMLTESRAGESPEPDKGVAAPGDSKEHLGRINATERAEFKASLDNSDIFNREVDDWNIG